MKEAPTSGTNGRNLRVSELEMRAEFENEFYQEGF